jgi:hypothetical protein
LSGLFFAWFHGMPSPKNDPAKPGTNLSPNALALLSRITGTPLEADRLQTLLADCGPILEEIGRLRTVDLGDLHPAVIYEPSAPYRRAGR